MTLIPCSNCGRNVSSYAETCPGCGVGLSFGLTCPDCGAIVQEDASCPECGCPPSAFSSSPRSVEDPSATTESGDLNPTAHPLRSPLDQTDENPPSSTDAPGHPQGPEQGIENESSKAEVPRVSVGANPSKARQSDRRIPMGLVIPVAVVGIGALGLWALKGRSNPEGPLQNREALLRVDSAMAEVYFQLKNSLPGVEAQRLLEDQRAWLQERATDCGVEITVPLVEAPEESLACLIRWNTGWVASLQQLYGRPQEAGPEVTGRTQPEIPTLPERIEVPDLPATEILEELPTLDFDPMDLEESPKPELPPPPEDLGGTDISPVPTYTPYTVVPEIRNRAEVARALEREYPPSLRDAGIGGTVQIWFSLDTYGTVLSTQVNESSGHKALDDAALAVARLIQFTPALNEEKPVAVWISLPITFTAR